MRPKYIIPLLLVAIGFNLGIALAAFAPRAYLPVIANGAIQPTITTLIQTDTSFVTAEMIPNTCRVMVTYIDRANGNKLHVAEDTDGSLYETALPPLGTSLQSISPEFVPSGPKQAFGDTVFVCGVMKVYFTGRDTGDDTGPFKLKRIDMNVPPVPPGR